MGRPRKSIEEKKEAGTYNVTRDKGKANLKVKHGIQDIKKPPYLDDNACKIWDYIVPELADEHITAIDVGLFSRWCSLFSDFCQITMAINDAGLLSKDADTGLSYVNNLYDNKLKISNGLLSLEKQLGFTPVTRNNVVVADKEDADMSVFMELLSK